ncbi:cellobiose 2-epimerase [Clostridia bacterium]|nr:cellobiose 2-epimerase [Clostridia bacterium]
MDKAGINGILKELHNLAMKDLVENLLPWWEAYSIDQENGGFYGEVDVNNRPIACANKYITLNARLVWTWSAAYRVLKNDKYKILADRAYYYFVDHFHDTKNGGYFTTVDYEGNVVDDHKFIYGNAFALYGLSEYARAFEHSEAKKLAEEQLFTLDRYAYDPLYKGYYETMSVSWKLTPWIRGMNLLPTDVKTMNTHLHLIEAITANMRINPTPYVRNKTREHLYNMLNRIVDHNIHHYYYFQDRLWNPTSSAISYGHDIEGSWLMLETADVLGEPEARRAARDTCVNIARACYEEAYADTNDGGLTCEYDPTTREKSQRYGWWEQCEAVVGFLNAYEETKEIYFLEASLKTLEFTLEHFVDHDKGGWFTNTDLSGKPLSTQKYKVSGPVCPYHNGRMAFEVMERCERLLSK